VRDDESLVRSDESLMRAHISTLVEEYGDDPDLQRGRRPARRGDPKTVTDPPATLRSCTTPMARWSAWSPPTSCDAVTRSGNPAESARTKRAASSDPHRPKP
jgi:hypothetical protein